MTRLKNADCSPGPLRKLFLPGEDKIAPNSPLATRVITSPTTPTLMVFDDVIAIHAEPSTSSIESDDSKPECYYYPDFLPNLLQLEVPVRSYLLKYIDPLTLASVELVNKACLRAVRARGYWKNVLVDVLGKTDAIEGRIVERYDDATRRSVGKRAYVSHSTTTASDVVEDGFSLANVSSLFHRRLWSRVCRDLSETEENVRRSRYISSLLLVYHLGQRNREEPIFHLDPSHRFVFSVTDASTEVVVTNIKRGEDRSPYRRGFVIQSQFPLTLNGDNNNFVAKATCVEVGEELLFVGCNNGAVIVWNWKTRRHVNQLAHRLGILVLKARPGGKLMIGSRDHTASLWIFSQDSDTSAPTVKATLRVTRGLIRAVEYDDQHAVVISDNTVGVWCLETEAHLRTLQGDTVTCISSLHGHLVVTGSIDRNIKLWDLTTGRCLKAMEECAAEVTCLVTDWKRDRMVTGDRKGNVRVWDLKKIADVRSCVVSHVISNTKFKGSLVLNLSYDGVTMFCTLRQRDNRDNHRKLTIKILDFAPDPKQIGRSIIDLPGKCLIS